MWTRRGTVAALTPLFVACQNGHLEVARLVVEKGAHVDQVDYDGAHVIVGPPGCGRAGASGRDCSAFGASLTALRARAALRAKKECPRRESNPDLHGHNNSKGVPLVLYGSSIAH